MAKIGETLSAVVADCPPRAPGDLWKVAAEASEDAVFGVDGNGTVLSWNRSAVRLFGYPPDEIIGWPTTTLVPLPHAEEQELRVARALSGERIERVPVDVRRRDGMVVRAALTMVPLPHGEGACCVARDLTEQQVAQATLAESQLRLREAQELSHVGLWLWDAATDALELSDELYGTHGLDPLDFDATMAAYLEVVHPEDRNRFRADLDRAVAADSGLEDEYRIVRQDGSVGWFYARGAVEHDGDGAVVGLRGIAQDVSERKYAAENLHRQASLLELLRRMTVAANQASDFEGALRACLPDLGLYAGWEVGFVSFVDDGRPRPSGIWWSDDPARFEPVRLALGRSRDETTSEAMEEALRTAQPVWRADLAADTDPRLAEAVATGLGSFVVVPLVVGTQVVALLELFSSARRPPDEQLLATVWDGANQLGRVLERTRAQDELSHGALHDSLTGLPNRTLLLDRLAHSLARRSPEHRFVALVFVDLDNFKLINDSLGHEAGDRLLVTIAHRLRHGLRPDDTVARFGGDEFIVLCDRLDSEEEAVDITDRILAALAEPIALDNAPPMVVTASAGIAITAGVDADPNTLLRDADLAMYRAKEAGRGRYQIFDAGMHRRASARLAIAGELRSGIDAGELRLLYQPQVAMPDGRLVGVEALVRWEHPQWGLLGPAEFIDVAEETQLIVPLGTWVLQEACRQASAWRRLRPDGPALKLCVNVSAKQLARHEFAAEVGSVLAEHDIDAASLCLEITESVLMTDVDFFGTSLADLEQLGVTIAIDDFGTGYSSLAYLSRYPIDIIKIDKGFVDGLDVPGRRGRAVVAAVVDLAHALDLVAVAEGVETERQLDILQQLGCDAVQGYYFAKPMKSAAITDLVSGATTPVLDPAGTR